VRADRSGAGPTRCDDPPPVVPVAAAPVVAAPAVAAPAPAPEVTADVVDLGAARQRKKRVRLLRFAVVTVALAVLIPLTLRGRLPSLASVWDAAQHAKWEWVLIALGLQGVSM